VPQQDESGPYRTAERLGPYRAPTDAQWRPCAETAAGSRLSDLQVANLVFGNFDKRFYLPEQREQQNELDSRARQDECGVSQYRHVPAGRKRIPAAATGLRTAG